MKVKIVECPRDAMQGIDNQILTLDKVEYINALLACNFDILDCGSFVSARAIPQMADTKEVLSLINSSENTKLLVIVPNERGAKEAAKFENISFIGFPFSVSQNFQKRNTNKSCEEAFETLMAINNIAQNANKETVAYISMCFGNPYNEYWSVDLVKEWVEKIVDIGITTISLSDTIGVATPSVIKELFSKLISAFPQIEFGAHFHTRPDNWEQNIEAAFEAGCRRFDGAILGLGGCPMAQDGLTGNLPTENLLSFLEQKQATTTVSMPHFARAIQLARKIF